MNEFDQRQYRLIKRSIEGFEAGNLNLRVLIDSLRSLVNILKEPEDEWKNLFNQEWWTLEEIYSIASDKEQTHLSANESNEVCDAIDNMKKLISRVILD